MAMLVLLRGCIIRVQRLAHELQGSRTIIRDNDPSFARGSRCAIARDQGAVFS